MALPCYNVVCISTIDWDFNWQGHQEIMSTLARQGHRVLFVENTGVRRASLKDIPRLRHRLRNWRRGIGGIRKVMDNVYVYAPLVLPFPYSRLVRLINGLLMRWTLRGWKHSMRFDSPIVWTWLPTPLALDLIRFFNAQMVIYYCCDNFAATSASSRWVRDSEDQLLREADLVFAHSKSLYDRCRRLAREVHVFQYGFNRDVFVCRKGHVPADLADIPRPILGYVGGIHKHIDQTLLRELAETYLDMSLVLVGPLQEPVPELAKLPNVFCLGQKKYEELPAYIEQFSVGLIPYQLNDYTSNVYPTKLNEYLIMGKPVVSTQLPEVEYFNRQHRGIVTVARDRAEFVGAVRAVVEQDSDSRRTQRIEQVRTNVWDEKISAMQRLIAAKLEEKAKSREVNWQESMVQVLKASRRRLALAGSATVLVWALIAHTPVLWEIGEPLRISEQAARADVIVVLAGGIGESGEPGEAYQEKVKHGVELFQQGYAGNVILSSGQTYVFREAQVMKALALSMRVPEESLVLEETGGGNYSALLNVGRIMREHGWSRALLVTSRYNTLRSQLVVKKHLADMRFTITPPLRSAYFGDGTSVAWKHVRAILHEYAAIGYYWMKGYV